MKDLRFLAGEQANRDPTEELTDCRQAPITTFHLPIASLCMSANCGWRVARRRRYRDRGSSRLTGVSIYIPFSRAGGRTRAREARRGGASVHWRALDPLWLGLAGRLAGWLPSKATGKCQKSFSVFVDNMDV